MNLGRNITMIEGETFTSNNRKVMERLINFINAIKNMKIKNYKTDDALSENMDNNNNIVSKFKRFKSLFTVNNL